jgi:hypothetical protein
MQTECSTELWKKAPLQVIPFLDELRTFVLRHNARRCPKWKFRFTEDLVMQIQPRPHGELFPVVAIQRDNAPADVFKRSRTEVMSLEPIALIEFVVLEDSFFPAWWLRPLSVRFRPRQDAFYQAGSALKHRVLSELRHLDSLNGVKMFQPSCLICGKPLTDPISMSRWIGPECATKCSFDARNRNLTACAAEEPAA